MSLRKLPFHGQFKEMDFLAMRRGEAPQPAEDITTFQRCGWNKSNLEVAAHPCCAALGYEMGGLGTNDRLSS